MQPGIWTSYFKDSTPEEAIRLFASRGWRALELSSEHGRILLDRGDPARTGEAFRRFAAEEGVTLPQGHLWLTCDIVGADGPATIEALRGWIDLYAAVGVRAAVLHPGGLALRQGADIHEINARRVEALTRLLDHARGTDLCICLENCKGISDTVDELLTIINLVGSDRLGICLDTGHLNEARGDQGDFIRRAGDRLLALHVDDNNGTADQHLMPFGLGTVDWAGFSAALRESSYAGLVNLEIGGEAHRCPFEVRLAKLDFLREVMRFLLQ